jgi:hypothetical protein
MLNPINWLIRCRFGTRHARGKEVGREMDIHERCVVTYACPRCGATWDRRIYRRGAASATPPQA